MVEFRKHTVITILVVAVIAVWFQTQGGQDRKRREIERALIEKKIGLLDDLQRNSAERLLNQWARDASLQQEVLLDRKFKAGALHVYSTGAESDKLTGNTRGNAIYDRKLDSIFVDHTLFDPQVVGLSTDGIYMKPHRGPTEYLHFLFLHELGHKILHRTTVSADEMKLEDEADNFAFEILANSPNSRASAIGYFNMSAFIVPGTPGEQKEPYLVDLAGSVFEIAGLTLFSSAPFSPFYSDTGHIPFIERAIRIAKAIVFRAKASETKNYSIFVEKNLHRIKLSRLPALTEILTSMPISAVHIAPTRMVVLSEAEHNTVGTYRDIPWPSAKCALRCRLTINLGVSKPTSLSGISSSVVTLFSDHSNLPALFSDESGLYRSEEGKWKKLYEPTSVVFDHSVVPTKSLIACKARKYWCVLNGTVEESAFPDAIIAPFLRDAGQLKGAFNFMSPVAFKRNRVHFVISEKKLEISEEIGQGILVVDVISGRPVEFKRMRFPEMHVETSANETLASRLFLQNASNRETIYAVTTTADAVDNSGPYVIQVWQLHEDTPPTLIAETNLIRQELGQFRDENEFGLQRRTFHVVKVATTHDETGALINVNGDSIYYFDSKTASLRLLAHPGGMQMATGPNNYFALYIPGGFKIYAGQL